MEKSDKDCREYRPLTLSNGLRVLVISAPMNDGETSLELSAAALCVGVGSSSDPTEIPGLAHLLEHLVFLGTALYPEENNFETFLVKRGGTSKAFTIDEATVFGISVLRESLKEALKRFSELFTSALLKESSMTGEIQVMDSEYWENYQCDIKRLNQLMRHLYRPGHPYRKFCTGNEESLMKQPRKAGVDVHKSLRKFYHKYYSAQFMTLAVISCEPLDQIEQYVVDTFSGVHNNSLPLISFADEPLPYPNDVLGQICKVYPVEDIHVLLIYWQMPSMKKHYMTKPLDFLKGLINQGSHRLFSILKCNGWVAHQDTEAGDSNLDFGLESTTDTNHSKFLVSISLTDLGNSHKMECCTLVFQYIKMLQQTPLDELRKCYEEMQINKKKAFDSIKCDSSEDYASDAAKAMQEYPVEHYLTGKYLMYEFNEKVIADVMLHLIPEKAAIFWLSKKHKCDASWSVEPWYQTQYKSEKMPHDWLDKWKCMAVPQVLDLHLPRTDLTEVSDAPSVPVIICRNKHFTIWHENGSQHSIGLCLLPEAPARTVENSICAQLFTSLLKQNLAEEIYKAESAQLTCSIGYVHICNGCIVVKMSGFNNRKQKALLESIFQAIGNFSVTEEAFLKEKEAIRKLCHNKCLDPAALCRGYLESLLQPQLYGGPQYGPDKLATIDSVSSTHLINFVKSLKSQLHVKAFFQGNILQAEAIEIMEHMRSVLNYKSSTDPRYLTAECPILKLPENCEFVVQAHSLNKSSPNSSTLIYHQFCLKSSEAAVMTSLLVKCLNRPFHTTLRTKEQLGYTATCTPYNVGKKVRVLGLCIHVVSQANKVPSDTVSKRIEAFIAKAGDLLLKIKEEDFVLHTKSMIASLESDIKIREKANNSITFLKKITKADLFSFYSEYFKVGAPQFKRIHICISGESFNSNPQPQFKESTEKDSEDVVATVRSFIESKTVPKKTRIVVIPTHSFGRVMSVLKLPGYTY